MLRARAAKSALAWSSGALAVALLAGAVRVLPWLLDPAVPARVALPFARSLAEAALEAALLVGWPVGWSMAAAAFAERGEARVLELLGERPARTALRLARQGLALGAALALVAFLGGRDATAPGRVAQELVDEARADCARGGEPVRVVPFVGASWLCPEGAAPRLYASGPGGLPVTGAALRLAGDLRRLEIDDARLRVPLAGGAVDVHVGVLALRGLAPWGQASTLPPLARGVTLALSAWAAAAAAVLLALRRASRTPLAALVRGAAGPLAVLGLMRALDRTDAPAAAYLALPVAAVAAAVAASAPVSRLLQRWRSVRVRPRHG